MTRERPRRASSARECSHALPRFDRDLQPIPERREGTHPLWVVAARRVVREVEVEYQLVTDCPEVRALRRVEKIAAAAVRRIAGGRIAEWEEDPAAVRVEPENFERTDVEIDRAETHERDHAAGAGAPVVALLGRCPDLSALGEAGVVVEVREAAEAGAFRRRQRRLRVGAKELVPPRSPEGMRRGSIGRELRADARVEIGHLPAPVEQRDIVLRRHRSAMSAFAKIPPITRDTVGKAWIVSARTEIGVRSFIASTASWIASDAAGPPMNAPTTILFLRSMTIDT